MVRPGVVLLLGAAVCLPAATPDAARQVLASRCWTCHGQMAAGGLRLDSREGMLRGGKSGPAVVAGNPEDSRLLAAIRRKPQAKPMPPGETLPQAEIETLRRWIGEGAPWPEAEGQHWSFLPLREQRSGESIDSAITKALEARGLSANGRADRRTLIRRLYFDLIGMPPSGGEFQQTFDDARPDWYSRLVERLLASPHFGEKWGRHWLDVARYGEDDYSGTAVIPYANAWRFRDWVVEAVNADMPYDRFLQAQLAGDRMQDPKLVGGTGLMGGGPWYYGIAQPPQSRADERHDRIDMVTRGMLGVTIACARCHDHKYDPFTAEDYYALGGVFASSAYREYPLVPEAEAAAWNARKKEVDEAEKAMHRYLDEQGVRLAAVYGQQIARYMLAADGGSAEGLAPKVVERWKQYLAKPEENHPFLEAWFGGRKTAVEAGAFQKLLLDIVAEKKALDEENRKSTEAAQKAEAKPVRTIVLPGGYRSEEDFNPGAYISSKSLERDRYVAWNRIFGETAAPLKLPRELTAELLEPDQRPEYDRLRSRHEALKKALPPQYPYIMGIGEFEAHDLHLNVRGNPEALGPLVPRRFPLALSGGRVVPLQEGSGRLQLARMVAQHPLAARVAVNRVWLALFGQGLVRTPSNFGRVGDRPSHPELLEYLAARFRAQGYSQKALIREILHSQTYQRSSAGNAKNEAADSDNRYLWRQNRRRLQAEPLRDAMLAASGELDPRIGGESAALDAQFPRRTLYAKTGRFQQEETLSLFDLPAAAVTCEQRVVTNVPLQKLFFLNSDIVAKRSEALARRISGQGVEAVYQLLFQRQPSATELSLARGFLGATPDAARWKQYAQVLLSSNEFAYVD